MFLEQSQPALANVPAAQRQPGDLVFFPGHVGISVPPPTAWPTGFPGVPD